MCLTEDKEDLPKYSTTLQGTLYHKDREKSRVFLKSI